jgi:tetratricopeptide (TPR) repeat protein
MDELAIKRAEKLIKTGLELAASGDFDEAEKRFRGSAQNYPSAEAYTYWGWMEHKLGRTDHAIELCKKAIEIDADFGNPYNDIGSYLISKGDLDAAITWLEKAIDAVRYIPRQYPHINLGRVYLLKGMPKLAVEHLRKALDYTPEDTALIRSIEKILSSLN